jgi:hypothetical protein
MTKYVWKSRSYHLGMNFPKELVLLTITKLPGRAGPINKDKPTLEG